MSRFDSPLDNLKIASPCSADWNGMLGDDRKRFCGECKLNVYNLSGMTTYDAEHLLQVSEGRLCVRYFQRPDGTVLTKDCPVGWARVKERLSIFATASFSLVVSLFAGLYGSSLFEKKVQVGRLRPIPVTTPTPTPEPLMGDVMMGNFAIPTPTPKPKSTPQREFQGREAVGRIADL